MVFWGGALFTILVIVRLLLINTVELLTLATLMLLIPLFTLISMIISWVNEHEADVKALKVVGSGALYSALVKTHIYGSVQQYLKYIKNIELEVFNITNIAMSYRKLLWILFQYSFIKAPLELIEFFKNTIYVTHPLLELRLFKIYQSSR